MIKLQQFKLRRRKPTDEATDFLFTSSDWFKNS